MVRVVLVLVVGRALILNLQNELSSLLLLLREKEYKWRRKLMTDPLFSPIPPINVEECWSAL
jgi:hypothetical protein